jgi:tubulin delta
MITLQVGQCGNQVGSALFSVLAEEALDTSRPHHRAAFDRFFRLKADSQHPIARAVLVDMEPKVIHTCVERASTFRYDTSRTFARQSGSANNWAFGYHFHGPSTRDAVMDLIRKEVELADRLTGFLALHSLAGGTGSGVGTTHILPIAACLCIFADVVLTGAYITDAVRDEFGARAALFNAVVWPFEVGEVILQNYNALLTLSSLTQASDAVILMENEQLHRICRQRLRLASPTFDDLNSVLARTLASALLPTYSSTPVLGTI